jgi:hypothetical protein
MSLLTIYTMSLKQQETATRICENLGTRKVARTKNTGNAGNGKHKVYQKEVLVLVLEPLSKLPEWHLILLR